MHALMQLDHLALIHYAYKLCLNALKLILNETKRKLLRDPYCICLEKAIY